MPRFPVTKAPFLEQRTTHGSQGPTGPAGPQGPAGGATAAAPTGNSTTDTATVYAAALIGLPLADGNYVCTAEGLNFPQNTQINMTSIHGSGRTTVTIPSSPQNHAGVRCWGQAVGTTDPTSSGIAYSLTVQANYGDQTLTIASADATALAANPGDYLHLWSNYEPPATLPVNHSVQGEIVRVQSVNTGTGVITIYGTLDDTYALSDVARLSKLVILDGCSIEGITFVNSTPLTGGSQMIEAAWTKDFRVRDVVIKFGDGPGIQMTDSIEWDLEYKVQDLANDVPAGRFGYGCITWGACRDGEVKILAERCRHAFTTGGDHFSAYATNPRHAGIPRHIGVHGQARETSDAGWDTHSEGFDIRFDGISSVGCQSAFNARAPGTKLMNWSFDNCRDGAYIMWTAVGFRCFPGICHRNMTGSTNAFNVGDSSGNTLSDIEFYGLHSDADGRAIAFRSVTDVSIFGPKITNPTSSQAFSANVGVSNVSIFFPVTKGVTTMVSGASAAGVTVFSPPGNTPINITTPPYNAKGDYQVVTDATILAGSLNTVSSPTANFSSLDTGKSVMVAGAGPAGVYLNTTLTYVNPTTATLATPASLPVASVRMAWATNNRPAIVLAIAAGATQIYVPNGNFYVDATPGAITVPDAVTFIGDSWNSILTFGPESATVCFAFAPSSGASVRFERIRLVGPQDVGATGAFLLSVTGTGGRMTWRDVNARLWNFAIQCSGVGTVVDVAGGEIEGRTAGGTNCLPIGHTAASGELRVRNCFIWNFGLNNNQGINAGTGINVDVDGCTFDNQTGTGTVVNHFDTAGAAPTANTFSRIRYNTFRSGCTGTAAIRTPYQGYSHVVGNDVLAAIRCVLVTAGAEVSGNHFNAPGAVTNFNMIEMAGVSTPIVSVPKLTCVGNVFEGTCQYAIYSNAAGDADVIGNDFLCGTGTAATGMVRFDSGVTSGSIIKIKANRFGGVTASQFAVKIGGGNVNISYNSFNGTYGGGVCASETGTPAKLVVRNNEFNQGSSTNSLVLTTTPTVLECQGNYGAGSGSPAGYRGPLNASNLTQRAADDIVGFSSAAIRTYTLLAGTLQTLGKVIQVVDESNQAGTNNITVSTNGTDTFLGGGTTKLLNTNGEKGFTYWNGTNFVWWTAA